MPPLSSPRAVDPYLPTWHSLQQHPTPAWFDDAKFGIYCHWGPYSVPAYSSEWYSHNMYVTGHPAHKYHLSHYGPLSEFGYKDFIPLFTAEHFDPDEWADLFRRAGARYAGPVTEHADGFSMWDSQVNPFNAARMGPRRDIVGELERAIRGQGMKFVTTFHHMWLWAWYPTYDKSVDASDPAYADLYGPLTRPGDFDNPAPDEPFCERFVAKLREVVDRYRPDLIYFDSRLNTIGEQYRQDFLAYYYNQAAGWGREVVVTYKNTDLPAGAGILDLERGRMSDLRSYKWLTDDSICWRSWADLQEPDYKSTKRLVDTLVDIVSKNGNLLLNIPPTADGRIPDGVRQRLLELGAWLDINGEAIYDTRPWQVFGEGPTQVHEGHFSEKDNQDLGAADIRFTTREGALYAICMGWPRGKLHIASLTSATLPPEQIGAVEMLGTGTSLQWTVDAGGLTIAPPPARPCDHAVTFKIHLK